MNDYGLNEYLDKPLTDKERRIVEEVYEQAHSAQRIAALEARNAELTTALDQIASGSGQSRPQSIIDEMRQLAQDALAGRKGMVIELLNGRIAELERDYEQVCRHVDNARADYHEEHEKNVALTARCARLAAALEWYADKENRIPKWTYDEDDPTDRPVFDSPVNLDLGRRARAALTAADARLATEWRAMEKVCEAGRMIFRPVGEATSPVFAALIDKLDKLAAVRAVEASKEGE